MPDQRLSTHSVAATHWSDIGSIYGGSTYLPPTSQIQTHSHSARFIAQGAQHNPAGICRTLYSNISEQHVPQHSSLTTSDYSSYSPTNSTIAVPSTSDFHDRRNQGPPTTGTYRDAVSQSTTLPSSYPNNVSHSYSQSRWHTNPHMQVAHGDPAVTQIYPHQTPLSQGTNSSLQYPASPLRPYACDLCALSFNRQHDLKRHRETHSGEKPYLCNGGCGKTFTRKDALKRHQLVKGCGKLVDIS